MIVKPNPCDGCDKKAYCKKNEVACRQFANFVTYGYFSVDTPKYPTIELFDKVFKDETEVNQLWERK